MTTRGLRRFKSANKYISRIKKYFSKFPTFRSIKRKLKPSTWKELSEEKDAKHLKNTPTNYTSEWDKVTRHRKTKSERMEARKEMHEIVNNQTQQEDGY